MKEAIQQAAEKFAYEYYDKHKIEDQFMFWRLADAFKKGTEFAQQIKPDTKELDKEQTIALIKGRIEDEFRKHHCLSDWQEIAARKLYSQWSEFFSNLQPNSKTSDAVDFALWLDTKGYLRSSEPEHENKWTINWFVFYSIEELYTEFKSQYTK